MRMLVRSLALLSESGIRCCWDLRYRSQMWLWLLCRPAAAALIRPLAWEHLHAMGEDLKRRKKERKKEREREKEKSKVQSCVCVMCYHVGQEWEDNIRQIGR